MILKSVITIATAFLLFNCGDATNSSDPNYIVSSQSYLYEGDDADYIIDQATGIVTNAETGEVVGTADFATGRIIATDNVTVLEEGIVFSELDQLTPPVISSDAWVLAADETYIIYPGTYQVTDANGTPVGTFVFDLDDAGNPVVNPELGFPTAGSIVDGEGETIVKEVDLSTLKVLPATINNVPNPDPNGGETPNPGTESSESVNPGLSSESSNPLSSSDGTILSSDSNQPTSSGANTHSSSSTANSSSSAKSSSSVASSSSQQSYQIKYVNGGKSGSGYATRYWDCCKPHCAWPEHGGKASTCDAQGNKIEDKSAGSMCDGGNAGICRNQFPIAVNDTLAFAFAATPGGESNCGKCFDLVFTGEGKYATDRHKKIKGHHLIVMSNNVGYDVAGGQFDVMIPGGGFGIFDGCSAKMGWGSQGSQYGGLLDQCEQETNYYAANYQKCLRTKCEKSFSMDPEALEGCLFLADWMNAAGNPLLNYKEVECPQELIDRF